MYQISVEKALCGQLMSKYDILYRGWEHGCQTWKKGRDDVCNPKGGQKGGRHIFTRELLG